MPSFSNIFEWSDWDDCGESKVFYECVLLRDVGEFKKGDKFSNMIWNDETLTLKFYATNEDYEPAMVKTLGLVD
jgi:hypothetical protein